MATRTTRRPPGWHLRTVCVELEEGCGTYHLDVLWHPGSPPEGPTYSCGGYPGDPAEAEVQVGPVQVTGRLDDDGEPLPDQVIDWQDLPVETASRLTAAVEQMCIDGDDQLEDGWEVG